MEKFCFLSCSGVGMPNQSSRMFFAFFFKRRFSFSRKFFLLIFFSTSLFLISCSPTSKDPPPSEEETDEDQLSDNPRRGSSRTGRAGRTSSCSSCSSCPSGNPSSGEKLADITFIYGKYRGSQYRSRNGRDPGYGGSSSPVQDILLWSSDDSFGDEHYWVLDKDLISWESEKTYYIYVDGERFALTPDRMSEYTVKGRTHKWFVSSFRGYLDGDMLRIHIASFKDGQCVFYGLSTSSPMDTPCPTGDPSLEEKLADITFIYGRYRGPQYRDHAGRDPGYGGSSSPVQDILLWSSDDGFGDEHYWVLDKDFISWESEKTYYIYVDGERFALTPDRVSEYTANGRTHKWFVSSSRGYLDGDMLRIHIASFKDNQCVFYKP